MFAPYLLEIEFYLHALLLTHVNAVLTFFALQIQHQGFKSIKSILLKKKNVTFPDNHIRDKILYT